MATSHTHDLRDRPHDDVEPNLHPRRSSLWLWGALAVAVLLAIGWWLQQRLAPATTESTPSTPTVAEREPPAATTQPIPADAPKTRRAPAPINREAQALASNADPVYPATALRAGIEGSVVARINVDRQGNVSDVAIVQREGSRDRALDRAVIEAARNWRFEPAMREGQAIDSVVQVPVDFTTTR